MRGAYRFSPRSPLTGLLRFLVYAALQTLVFSASFPYLGAVFLVLLLVGHDEKLDWLRWLRCSSGLLLMAAAPAVAGFPYASLAGMHTEQVRLPPGWFETWLPALLRSLRFFLVFMSAAWLSYRMSALELRAVLERLLQPLGKRWRVRIARSVGLVLAFLPWTREELQRAGEAVRLRGCDPRRQPVRYLGGLAVPVALRSLERARHSAEALLLRDVQLAEDMGQPRGGSAR